MGLTVCLCRILKYVYEGQESASAFALSLSEHISSYLHVCIGIRVYSLCMCHILWCLCTTLCYQIGQLPLLLYPLPVSKFRTSKEAEIGGVFKLFFFLVFLLKHPAFSLIRNICLIFLEQVEQKKMSTLRYES